MTRSDYQPVVSEGAEAAAGGGPRCDKGGATSDPAGATALGQVGGASASAVQQFFRGRCVLVTGATGFMGKVLVEKLLRCCPAVHTVYAVIRSKKGRTVEQRIHDMFKDSVFMHLREEQRRRLVAAAGDVSQPGLGLSAEDRARLCQDVSVVFHLAATVRFDEAMRVAASINVRGTMEVLRLCRDMPKLKVVVHTSTAYSQYVRPRVLERFYEAPISADKLLTLCEALPEGQQHDLQLASKLLGGYPNTYVFTKAVAEEMVSQEFSDLPIAVIRPAMVSSTHTEPYPGWIDNLYGPTGVSVGAATGLLRVMQCDSRAMANIVPCDMSVNLAIAAAWDLAANRRNKNEGEQPVYHHVSSADCPLTWYEYRASFMRHGMKIPTVHAVWYVSLMLVANRFLFLFWKTMLHLVPAMIVDTALLLVGKKPMLMRGYRKIHRFIDVCAPFATHHWDFDNSQTKALWARLSSEDRKLLPFDMRGFDWDEYFYHYVRGARRLLLKDEMDTVPAARRRWRRLLWLHRAVNTLIFLLLASIAWRAGNSIISVIR
ncbi:fatty acyl-CoA reductase wat-like isoform X1 [Schistocerca americana]|uniref:fatty acyl-CoA reductase wat-like isoform X1 n=1 Tax=Schistocerca americana TaxID=7009 RepID=UPI001F4F5907|nr:fatty acyl-CoA reductase wat-like isoform X1 [Schistocerca americana]XP_046979494.1 fatty acyl-CoA reductase wat-like isoform X1 [Schistocerca americana]